jgi:acyl-CoA thioester hydrolase
VYHATYLRYAERARTEALRDAGIAHADLVERFSLMFMVRRAEIDYVRPATLDDTLVVETETKDVGGATVLLRQTVRGPNGVCATLRIKLACVRIGGNKPARIPPAWRDRLVAIRRDVALATEEGE